MGESTRDKELTMVVGREFYGEMLSESGTGAPQIDRHIKHFAFNTLYQFRLGKGGALEMQAAHYAIDGSRHIVLYETGGYACSLITGFVVGFSKETTGVTKHIRLDDKQTFNRCFDYLHNECKDRKNLAYLQIMCIFVRCFSCTTEGTDLSQMGVYGHINKTVLRLAVPSILANITIPLVGIVDTAIAGHISNAAAIGGIAIGSMLFDLLYWNFGFLRIGTAGMTAQAWGRHNNPHTGETDTSAILLQALTMALGGAMLILLLQWVFLTAALALVPCSAEVADFARRYFFIRVWAAPATLSLMALKGWFIGMQNTVAPMVTDLVVNSVNMLASWLLAVYTPLGAMGVAWGTLIAQYAGLAVSAVILAWKYKLSLPREVVSDSIRWRKMKRLAVLNSNLFVRSLCFMVVYVGFTSLASKYGDTQLAVSSIMMKLFMLFSYFVDGFAYAGEALTGRFIGEKDGMRLQVAIRVLFVWTLGIGLLCTAIYGLAGTKMIAVMTNEKDIIAASEPYMVWLILMPLVSCVAFMWDGIYVGATAGKELRNSMIWSAVGFVAAYFILEHRWGIQALYIAYFVHLAVRTLFLSMAWRKVKQGLV